MKNDRSHEDYRSLRHISRKEVYALGRNLEKMLGRPLYSFTSTVRSGLGA